MNTDDEWHETSENVNLGRHGMDFEIEFSKFLFKRLMDSNYKNFRFTREKRGLGKFDDLTYIYETEDGRRKFDLVQLKHIANENKKIGYEALTTDKNSYFLLPKYFSYYLESTKSIFSDKDFSTAELDGLFICTNITFDGDLGGVQTREVNNDGLFKNSGFLYKIDIPLAEKRKIFAENYISNTKKLANELSHYIMLGKDIDIKCLKIDNHASMVKIYHVPLARDVISVSAKKLKREFIEGELDEKTPLSELRECLFESVSQFCSNYADFSEEELKTRFNIKYKKAQELKNRLSDFKSGNSVQEFLEKQTIKLRSGFGDTSMFPDDDLELPIEQNLDIDVMDNHIDRFLQLLTFAVEQNDHQNIIKREMEEEVFIAFSDKMNRWYHEGSFKSRDSKGLFLKKRQWLTKDRLEVEAMETTINFQGREIKLKQLVSDKKLLDPDILLRAFSSLNIRIGSEVSELTKVKSYYIPRCLWRQKTLYKNVPILNKKDFFIISHMRDDDDKEIGKMGTPCIWSNMNVSPKTSSRLIIAGCEFTSENFDTLANSYLDDDSSVNVHWLKFCKDYFLWESTFGSLAGLQPHFQNTSENIEIMNESDVCKNNRFLVLSGEPGIGKSTLLNSIAERLTKHEKESPDWIIKISLKDCGEKLDELEHLQSIDNVVEFISSFENIDSKFGRNLLSHLITNEDRLVIFIDGFDELYSEERQEQVTEFLKFLKLKSKVKNVVVTTRSHLKDILEDCLGVISYSIKEISEEEQIKFLTQYWKQTSCLDEHQISEYAKKLITNFNNATAHYGKSIFGIPLQTYMLAVIFQQEALKLSLDISESLPITTLFEKFLNARYEIYLEKSGEKVQKNNRKQQLQLKVYDKLHQDFAIHYGGVFSSDEAEAFITLTNSWEYDILLDIGIIYKFNDAFHFTHKTFAEYLTVKRLVDVSVNLKKYNPDCKRLIAKNFLKPGNEFLRYLFDLKLTEQFPLHSFVVARDEVKIQAFNKEEANAEDCLGRKVLNYAMHYGSFDMVRNLCKKGGVIGEDWEDWEERLDENLENIDWKLFWMRILTSVLIEFWEEEGKENWKEYWKGHEKAQCKQVLKTWYKEFLKDFFKEVLKDVLKEIWKAVLSEVLKGIWKKSWEKDWEKAWEEVWEEMWEEDWKSVWNNVGKALNQEIRKEIPDEAENENWSEVWNEISKKMWMEFGEAFQEEFGEELWRKDSEEWRRIRKARKEILKVIRKMTRKRIQERVGEDPNMH